MVPIYLELPFYTHFLERGRRVRIDTHPNMSWRRYERYELISTLGDP